ncbi:hypothetical protein GCM10011374_34030 [Kocuria dechangensis]|uniref:Helix-turn-helix protein n=1 Tax=Kocuria dechangensis TaxID=1176249 RepID=A0A917H472_9MICC|nr:hypothetical protein GCM10011374_34030 [Kocuria dechangensis]
MYRQGIPHAPAATYSGGMDNRTEVRDFLMSRRAKLTPEEAGLPAVGNRRVPGLRRTEVAALAGVSVEYYAKLERGAIAGAPDRRRRGRACSGRSSRSPAGSPSCGTSTRTCWPPTRSGAPSTPR